MSEANTIDVEVEGWKGEDEPELELLTTGGTLQGFNYITNRKQKDTGDVETNEHFVKLKRVVHMDEIIRMNIDVGESTNYRGLIEDVMEHRGIGVQTELKDETLSEMKELSPVAKADIITTIKELLEEAFNGGKFRKMYYFPHYYYPLKILEAYGVIDYPKTITLNTEDSFIDVLKESLKDKGLIE